MKKKVQIHLIQTDKESKLYIKNNTLKIGSLVEGSSRQHLYFTTDEEIKTGDWYMYTDGGSKEIRQCISTTELDVISSTGIAKRYVVSKIVATTNPELWEIRKTPCELLKDNGKCIYTITKIPDSFIQHYIKEYNKRVKIEEVMVEYTGIKVAGDRRLMRTPTGYEYTDLEYTKESKISINPDGTCITSPVEGITLDIEHNGKRVVFNNLTEEQFKVIQELDSLKLNTPRRSTL